MFLLKVIYDCRFLCKMIEIIYNVYSGKMLAFPLLYVFLHHTSILLVPISFHFHGNNVFHSCFLCILTVDFSFQISIFTKSQFIIIIFSFTAILSVSNYLFILLFPALPSIFLMLHCYLLESPVLFA